MYYSSKGAFEPQLDTKLQLTTTREIKQLHPEMAAVASASHSVEMLLERSVQGITRRRLQQLNQW